MPSATATPSPTAAPSPTVRPTLSAGDPCGDGDEVLCGPSENLVCLPGTDGPAWAAAGGCGILATCTLGACHFPPVDCCQEGQSYCEAGAAWICEATPEACGTYHRTSCAKGCLEGLCSLTSCTEGCEAPAARCEDRVCIGTDPRSFRVRVVYLAARPRRGDDDPRYWDAESFGRSALPDLALLVEQDSGERRISPSDGADSLVSTPASEYFYLSPADPVRRIALLDLDEGESDEVIMEAIAPAFLSPETLEAGYLRWSDFAARPPMVILAVDRLPFP